MVKKILILIFLILIIIFPPVYPKKFIKGDTNKIDDFYGFVFTYFNNEIERESIFKYRVKEFNLKGVILKNLNSSKSYIFDKNGKFVKEGEVSGFPLIFCKGDSIKNYYESIKNYFLSYINIYEILKELNLTPYLDCEKDEIYLENEKLKVNLGRENFTKRVENLKLLLQKEDISGTLDASYDNIIIIKGKWWRRF